MKIDWLSVLTWTVGVPVVVVVFWFVVIYVIGGVL